MDLEAIKQAQQKVWGSGDYAAIGSTLQIVAELLCEAVDLRGGQNVLDIATGTGNAAIAAARRSCTVTGIDYVPALIERGRLRAAAEGLTVTFIEGDAESLPYPDASFDVVLSTFGVMFAPNHRKAAAEMARVCRSGGKLGLASWSPDGVFGASGRVTAGLLPPQPLVDAPALWGTAGHLADLFGDNVVFTTRKQIVMYRYPSLDRYMERLRTTYPPVMNTFAKLDAATAAKLDTALRDLYGASNRATDGTFLMPMEYLEAVGRKQ